MKLGKQAPRRLLSTPAFGDFIDKATTWPAVKPRGWEYAVPPDKLDILANDTIGNCVIEGTEVCATEVHAAYKAPYSGPVVHITTKSGKSLTVTPNHAILTPRGFTLAKFIEKGDYLIGTRGSKPLPDSLFGGGEFDFNKTPTLVEEVFSTLRLADRLPLKIMPSPIHFHGDGQFINSDVDVVRTEGFLGGELNPALSEPYGHDEIGTTRKLERHFIRPSALRHTPRRSGVTTHGSVGASSDGTSFFNGQSGVSQSQRLPLRSQAVSGLGDGISQSSAVNTELCAERIHSLSSNISPNRARKITSTSRIEELDGLRPRSGFYASELHPSIKGSFIDAELARNLTQRFPGLIEDDCVVDVEINEFSGHIYDLSTESRWYLSNGIISHNCVIAAMMHYAQAETANTSNPLTPTAQLTIETYSAITGYDPNDPSTDQGTNYADALAYWKKHGIPMLDSTGKEVIHKILGWASLDLGSIAQQRYACDLFGGTLMGIQCPQSAEDDTSNWTYDPNSPIIGGHGINRAGQGGAGWHIGSWGLWIQGTWEFSLKLADEDYCVVTPFWIGQQGKSPSGLDLNGLVAAMKLL